MDLASNLLGCARSRHAGQHPEQKRRHPPNGPELSRSAGAGKTSPQYRTGLQPNQDATDGSPPGQLERVVGRRPTMESAAVERENDPSLPCLPLPPSSIGGFIRNGGSQRTRRTPQANCDRKVQAESPHNYRNEVERARKRRPCGDNDEL